MGADDKVNVDTVGQSLPGLPSFPADMASLQPLASSIFSAVVVLLLLAGLYKIAPRLWKTIEETIFSNWRLGLLAATGLVLSLASGWTTWDGMRNFTSEPILSLMITFGIQGVMLIIAWLIGESFATGMSQQATGASRGTISKGFQAGAGGLIGTLLFVTMAVLFMQTTGQVDVRTGAAATVDLWQISDKLLIIVAGLLLAALVALYSASDIVKPYLQSSRVIIKNAILWVMFLACMVTSVFFSFDSLFSAIFPQSERVRAAELRAQNQVSGIVADIGSTIATRRNTAADDLFRSEGWTAYEQQLDALATASRGAEGQIEAYYVQKMEQRRSAIAEQQERAATAESGQAGLNGKKASLTEELSRIEAERPALAIELAQKKSEFETRAKEIDAKRVEAMAEDKGVEGTLKEGKGPIYRERIGELGKLQDYSKIGEQRVKDAQKRIDEVNSKIDKLKRELAEIDGSLAKLSGEADTAKQRIAAATTGDTEETAPKIDPSRVLPAFETARAEFRQKPETEHLAKLQDQCSQLFTAMTSTPTTKDRVAGIDCDPKRALEAGAVLFALNSGAKMFTASCAGGDKLAANTSADALFGFSRRCLADSGLPSQETGTLRTKINFIELNRDDKAHRFVVTWNAFQDGNRLAYLALAIAIAIDGLIFMSGLFGANAVRSPLSDVPSYKARSAQQLEAIVENALLPDTFETARMTLQSMRPITNLSGFMAEVRPERLDPQSAERVVGVLNAGATIHAVEYDPSEDRYLVRAELFEFLSVIAKKAFESNDQNATFAELEKMVAVALLPDVAANADTVLSYVHPYHHAKSGNPEYTAEVKLSDVADAHKRTVRSVLNAGSALQRVQRAGEAAEHYFIHRDLYKTLARIRARSMYSGSEQARITNASSPRDPAFGGSLRDHQAALEHRPHNEGLAGQSTVEDARLLQPIDTDRLAALYLDQLLAPVGLMAGDIIRSFDNEDIRSAAEDSWKTLEQSGQINERLGMFLTQEQRRHEAAIDQAYRSLRPGAADDPRKLQLLNTMHAKIRDSWSVVMLHPGVGMVKQLISQLEYAASPDEDRNLGEQDLLDRLRGIQKDLRRMNFDHPDSWRRIEDALLASADSDMPQVIRGQRRNDSI